MPISPDGTAKDKLLAAAAEMFYEQGIRAVGIDALLEHAGISKMTLYKHFASKDALVVEYLKRTEVWYWQWFDECMPTQLSAREKLLHWFATLSKWIASGGCRGCPFINALVEFPEPAHPVHQAVLDYKEELKRRVLLLTKSAGAADPESLADKLIMLSDAAYVSQQQFGPNGPGVHVEELARLLLDAELPKV